MRQFGAIGGSVKKGQFQDFGVAPGDLRSPAAARAHARREARAGACLASARAALEGFGRGAHVFGVTRGQFSMIDLAAAALELAGPADVSCWTWCIASYELEAVGAWLMDRRIRSLRMVIDWTGAQREAPWISELQTKFGADVLRVTKTHAKIVTISTDCGWRIVVRGSMNLNNNPRLEQFDVSDDPAIFDVVRGLEDEMWARGKALPVRKLRHSDAVSLFGAAGESSAPAALPDWAAGTGGGDWHG